MEQGLIFDAGAGDTVVGDTDANIQVAAAAHPSEDQPPRPRDAAQVVMPEGQTVVRILVAPGEVIELPFPSDAQFLARIEGGNLAIKVGDLTVILQGYVDAADRAPPVIVAADGRPLDIAAILAATDPAIEIETAAGPGGAQGQGADNTGALLTPFGAAGGGLGGFSSVGGQEDSNAPSGGPGVDQTGTLFRQFGEITPTAPVAPDFEFDTDEESKISGKVVATDPQGDPLTYALVGATPAGLTFNADGSWSFDPTGKYDQLNTDSPGQVTFQYKANDGVNDSNTATVVIDIAGINDAPQVSGIDTIAFAEDTVVPSVPMDWQIFDPDDTTHTIEVDKSTLPPGVTYDADKGRLHFDTVGKYDYLAEGEKGSFTIKFTVTDAHGASAEHNVALSILGANDAPVPSDDIVITNSGKSRFDIPEWALLANDKDAEGDYVGISMVAQATGYSSFSVVGGSGSNGYVRFGDDDTPGGSFAYKATDGTTESAFANVGIENRWGSELQGTDADEILIGTEFNETIDGGAGNDIIFGRGHFIDSDNLNGGAGDDVIAYERFAHTNGGTDNLASSGGLAESADKRGDVLALTEGVNFAEAPGHISLEGIETISAQEKFGGLGSQRLTIDAASVQRLSDHTITPGGGYAEHEAIRVDSDIPDRIYLTAGAGGAWVDTGIEMAGYRIYAHETTEGDPASADAYVMVQSANVDTVRLNMEAPVVVDDYLLTNNGFNAFLVPDWALTINDKNVDAKVADVAYKMADVELDISAQPGQLGVTDKGALGAMFEYGASNGTDIVRASVAMTNQAGGDINGGSESEIIVGSGDDEKISGGGGNDIIFGGGSDDFGDRLYGDAGDDIIAFDRESEIHGGSDSVSPNGGLGSEGQHGDILIGTTNITLVDGEIDGIETVSTEAKFGGVGAQLVTVDAAGVMAVSDHTITPGGAYGTHEAIRIDGDTVDHVYLSLGNGAGEWVATGIEMAGYHIYAHQTIPNEPTSTVAYVMVQSANIGNVHLNEDGRPVAADDSVFTNLGASQSIVIPEWAILRNDKSIDGANLDVAGILNAGGSSGYGHAPGTGANGTVEFEEDAALGGWFTYEATDGGVERNTGKATIHNQDGGNLGGTAADEILVGRSGTDKIEGGGGNDIIFGGGGSDLIYGGGGDDVLAGIDDGSVRSGGADSVAASGGLAAGADQHGDVLVASGNLNLPSYFQAGSIESIETISMQEEFGAVGAQTLTLGASAVKQMSDHTITPGGEYGEHEAIRVDGDAADHVVLTVTVDGGQWVDTGIEMAGYRIYAHQTVGGDPASTDAYVMVLAAHAANVHLIPVTAGNDIVLTNAGTDSFSIPEWALLANDTGPSNLDVGPDSYGVTGFNGLDHYFGTGSNGDYEVHDDGTPGGSFGYKATDGYQQSEVATVSVQNKDGDIAGTDADEILVGSAGSDRIEAGGGNDIIFGGGGSDLIFGGAGDDVLASIDNGSTRSGDTDTVASSGGLAAGVDQHGDVLVLDGNLDFSSAFNTNGIVGIETLSMQEKFGAVGMQSLTLGASAVQTISDHTITPGGVFAEHEAIRIDGDAVDDLYLSISKDGGKWVDTGVAVAGYQVYAHQATEGDAASTDAYVMVQSANTGNVHLNQDAP